MLCVYTYKHIHLYTNTWHVLLYLQKCVHDTFYFPQKILNPYKGFQMQELQRDATCSLGPDDHAGFIAFSAKLWLPDRCDCTYIFMFVYSYRYVLIYVYIYKCLNIYIYKYIRMCTYVYISLYIYIHIYTCIMYICIYVYIYMYDVYTYISEYV